VETITATREAPTMTTTLTIDATFEELASRSANGISVTLAWRRSDDALKVVVTDARYDETFEIEVGDDPPLDVFNHPFAYAAFRESSLPRAELSFLAG
jgi:hypothetical protein